MTKLSLVCVLTACASVICAETAIVQDGREVYVHAVNYDVSKIAPYTLEDPLTFADGSKVKTVEDWAKRRREILDIFAREMYGEEPPKPETDRKSVV